jgi:hypothetical protein
LLRAIAAVRCVYAAAQKKVKTPSDLAKAMFAEAKLVEVSQ